MANGSRGYEVEDNSVEVRNNYDNAEEETRRRSDMALANRDSLTSQAVSSVSKQNGGGHYGSVIVDHSENVTVGTKAILHGDLTINTFIYPNGEVKEDNPLTDNLPVPDDVLVKTKNGKCENGVKPHPILHITQQQSVTEKGFVNEWWRWMSCAFAGALLVMGILFFLLWWIPIKSATSNDPIPLPEQYPFVIPENLTDGEVNLNKTLHIIQRNEWEALEPVGEENPLVFPIPLVVIHHTVTPPCFTLATCTNIVQRIQRDQIDSANSLHFSDIGYNFLIGGNGDIYVGRSWDYEGSHTYLKNRCSIGIALIGTFHTEESEGPTDRQMEALKYLLITGVKLKKITEDYKLYAASNLRSTASPGIKVVKVIEKWQHWSTIPITCESANVTIINRSVWGAAPSKGNLIEVGPIVPLVIIHQTASSSCFTFDDCKDIVKNIQTDQMNNSKKNDIGYNFLIGGNGFIYVGRDWDFVGSHTDEFNYCSIGIALIGSFYNDTNHPYETAAPTDIQMMALRNLIQQGVKSMSLSRDFKLYSANTLIPTTAPAIKVNEIISKWRHWKTDKIASCNINSTDNAVILSQKLHIVNRDEWLARSPDPRVDVVTLIPPIPYVIIHHTAGVQCFSNTECMKLLLSIQNYHISLSYGDIGYNFLIGGDGYVYTGRSWEYMGAHTYPYNRCTIGIAFIGSFDRDEPTDDQMEALRLLLLVGVEIGQIRKDYDLYCASSISSTESPGKNLRERLESWPHYSKKDLNAKDCMRRIDLNKTELN